MLKFALDEILLIVVLMLSMVFKRRIKVKIKLLAIFSFMIFIFSGCVSQQNVIKSNPLGKVYKNSINVRNMELPLPGGEWKIVGRGYAYSYQYVELILEQDIGDKPYRVVSIMRDSSRNTYTGYMADEYLKRTDIHHVVSNKNKRDEPLDGWLINHYRLSFGGNLSAASREAYKYIIDNKLVMPGNLIERYHVFSGDFKK